MRHWHYLAEGDRSPAYRTKADLSMALPERLLGVWVTLERCRKACAIMPSPEYPTVRTRTERRVREQDAMTAMRDRVARTFLGR